MSISTNSKRVKAILIEDEIDLREILEMIIKSSFDIDLLLHDNAEDALNDLNTDENIAFIFSDYNLPGQSGGDLYKYNLANKKLPFILCSGGFIEEYSEFDNFLKESPLNAFIAKPFDDSQIFEAINKILRNSENEIGDDLIASGYRRVKISLLLDKSFSEGSIYIKLGPDKFIKVFNAGDEVDFERLIGYRVKGEEYAYLESNDFAKLIESSNEDLLIKIRQASDLKSVMNITGKTIEFLSSQILNLGIDKKSIELVDQAVSHCTDTLMKDPKLSRIFENFFKEGGYLVNHSMNAIHISIAIAEKMGLDKHQVSPKFIYAGLLHDIGLEDDKHSAILSKKHPYFKELNQKDAELVLNHPKKAYDIVNKIPNLPNDVNNIIWEHHELPDGTGFPRGLGASRISPLSAIFIVSLRVADFMYYNSPSPDKFNRFVELLLVKYSEGPFSKVSNALLKLINEQMKKEN